MNTAIIGLGPHGKRLVKVVGNLPQLKLCGLVDTNQAALAEFEPELCFSSTSTLYQENAIDVVLIATNGPSHSKLAIEAMENGAKYVMVEKPMACSVAECRLMEEAANKHGVRLSINKKNRHDPVIQYFRENLMNGDWGQIKTIFLQIPGIGLGCLSTHWTDVTSFLIDRLPIKVTGWVDEPKTKNPRGEQFVDPGGLLVLDYGQEVRAIVSQIEEGAGPMTMEIHTTAARVIYDPKNEFLDIRVRDLTQKPGPGRPPVYNHIAPPSHLNIKGDMIEQMTAVVHELIGNQPMLTAAEHGTSAIEIITAAYISNAQGNVPIPLPLTDPAHTNTYLPIT